MNIAPCALNPEPCTLNPEPCALNPERRAPHRESLNLNNDKTFHAGPANTWAANLLPAKCVALPEGSLPLRDLTFLSDNTVVAAGYDCTPVLFEANVANQVVQSWYVPIPKTQSPVCCNTRLIARTPVLPRILNPQPVNHTPISHKPYTLYPTNYQP